jgi:hypothetical protein
MTEERKVRRGDVSGIDRFGVAAGNQTSGTHSSAASEIDCTRSFATATGVRLEGEVRETWPFETSSSSECVSLIHPVRTSQEAHSVSIK